MVKTIAVTAIVSRRLMDLRKKLQFCDIVRSARQPLFPSLRTRATHQGVIRVVRRLRIQVEVLISPCSRN